MKTKSRAVRRNSSGCHLQDDVCVSIGDDVDDACPPTPVLENLGPGVSLLLDKDTVSDDVVVRRDEVGPSVGMDVSFGCDHGVSHVVEPPVRMAGGITINEPDSYCHSAHLPSQRLSGSVDYVGKGKRKADDILPPSYHGFGGVAADVSAPSLAGRNTNHLASSSSAHSVVGTSTAPCIISHPNNAPAVPDTDNATPAVFPAVALAR